MDVIHRTTLVYEGSVNTSEYPEPTYKHSPDMSAVATGSGSSIVFTVPMRYWKAPVSWSGNVGPVEMTQPEKDAVDAAIATAIADEGSDVADNGVGGLNTAEWQAIRQVLREVNQDHNKWQSRIVDEIHVLLLELVAAFAAVKASTGGSTNIRDAIPASFTDTLTTAQNRAVSNFISDYRQNLRDKESQV